MVITVTCPSCSSSFPVDPAKIPAGGVNARCSSCGSVFRVEKPAEAAPPPPEPMAAPVPPPPPAPAPPPPPVMEEPAPEPAAPAAEAADDWVVETEEPEPLPTFADAPEPAAAPAADPFAAAAPFEAAPPPEPTPPPAPEPPPAPPAAPVEEAAPAVQGFTFGKRDPTDKAKRLARVLVSDMIMYNAERHQTALTSGTLAQDFEEEIEKSWREFVEQVGEELANGPGRGFWTEALNDILAKGEQVF